MRFAIVLCILALAPSGLMKAASQAPSAEPQSRITALVQMLSTNDIQTIEIIQMPPRQFTRTRVTPALLERGFSYKLVIRDLPESAYHPTLLASVKSISILPSDEIGDLRWGISFYDRAGAKIQSIYLDAAGGRGFIDSAPVAIKGGFPDWLKENFSKIFK